MATKRGFEMPKWRGGKVPREAPPPSKWGQNQAGTSKFVVRKLRHRNMRGQKLYRLGYAGHGDKPLFGTQVWTLDQLIAEGVVWLKTSPFTSPEADNAEMDNVIPMDAVETPEVAEVAEELVAKPAPGISVNDLFHREFGFKVGDHFMHPSGNTFEVVEILSADSAKVRQVTNDGVKKPARKMKGAKMSPIR